MKLTIVLQGSGAEGRLNVVQCKHKLLLDHKQQQRRRQGKRYMYLKSEFAFFLTSLTVLA